MSCLLSGRLDVQSGLLSVAMAGEGVIIYSGLLALQTKTEQVPVAESPGSISGFGELPILQAVERDRY